MGEIVVGVVAGIAVVAITGRVTTNLLGLAGIGVDAGGEYGNVDELEAGGKGFSAVGSAKDIYAAGKDIAGALSKPKTPLPPPAAAAKPAAIIGEKTISRIATRFPTAGKVLTTASKGLTKLIKAVGKAGGPIAILAGAYGLVTGIIDAAKADNAEKRGLAIANAVAGGLTAAGGLAMLLPGIGPLVGSILLAIAGLITLGTMIYEYRELIWKGLTAIWNGLKIAGTAIFKFLVGLFKNVFGFLKGLASKIAKFIAKVAKAIAKFFAKVAKAIAKFFAKVAKAIAKAAKAAVKAVAKAAKTAVKAIAKAAKAAVKAIAKAAKAAGRAIAKAAKKIGSLFKKLKFW